MTDRDRVLRTIRALLQKTVVNGCPVEEALAAHANAQALIDKYQVSHEELYSRGAGSFNHTLRPAERGEKLWLWNEQPLRSHQAFAEIAQKVALSEQTLGARFVQYDLGVHGISDLETHFQRKVRLDKPGDDSAVRSLRREHQVNA